MIWTRLVPHKVVLKNVQRQKEAYLVKAINETARGSPSPDTIALIKIFNNNVARKTKLFAKRCDVYVENSCRLMELDGDIMVYTSVDGPGISNKMRQSVHAPQQLALKVGAPVILIKNLSNHLVNGLTGVVKDMSNDTVSGYFTDIKETCQLGKERFFQFDRRTDKMVMVTEQFPLVLAFAMTIHKSQGLTLESVAVDCQGAFEPGQVSVAIGRVRSKGGISVTNFRPSLCPPQPPHINSFYGSKSEDLHPDLTCCKQVIFSTHSNDPLPSMQYESELDSQGSQESENEEELLIERDENINCDNDDSFIYPSELDGNYLKPKCVFSDPFTKTQREMNVIMNDAKGLERNNHEACEPGFELFCQQVQ